MVILPPPVFDDNSGQHPCFGVIGGGGKMGTWFADTFRSHGYQVIKADRNDASGQTGDSGAWHSGDSGGDSGAWHSNLDLVTRSQIVVLAVPISEAVQVVKEISGRLTPEHTVIELLSVKHGVVGALLDTEAEIISLHPMFSPTVSNRGQRAIICPVRGARHHDLILRVLTAEGIEHHFSTVERHDQMMGVIQGLNHFTAITLVKTLHSLGISPEEAEVFSSPVYRITMALAGRILAQNCELYGDISISNPGVTNCISEYLVQASQLLSAISDGDRDRYREIFHMAAEHLGGHAQSFHSFSDQLIEGFAKKKDLKAP